MTFVVRPKARRDIADLAERASDRFIDVYRAFELLSKIPHMGSARRFRRESLNGLACGAFRSSKNTSSCIGQRRAE